MASNLNAQNLKNLGKNHATTAAGQAVGVKAAGSSRVAMAWAKVVGAVKSSKIGTWFAKNPLKGAVIGGAAIDAAFETAFYLDSRNDLKKLAAAMEKTGAATLLTDITELPDYEVLQDVFDRERNLSANAATADFSDEEVGVMLDTYVGLLGTEGKRFAFTEAQQAAVDVLCIAAGSFLIESGNFADAAELDTAMGAALDLTDTSTLMELAGELQSDYETCRTPARPSSSRLLDFQSFIRYSNLVGILSNLGSSAVAVTTKDVAEVAQGLKTIKSVPDECVEGGAQTVVSNDPAAPLDFDSLVENLNDIEDYE